MNGYGEKKCVEVTGWDLFFIGAGAAIIIALIDEALEATEGKV
jgi:hypothetical protein